jgi:hypothetical protein
LRTFFGFQKEYTEEEEEESELKEYAWALENDDQ